MPERVSPQQREAEPFRWCIHCDADCNQSDAEHAEWCPSATGLHPVRTVWHCGHCLRGFEEPRFDPYACAECGAAFGRGDSYLYRPVPDMGDDMFESVCVGCGVAG